jgi:hypothetical protein
LVAAVIAILYLVCAVWLAAPLTIALSGGSIFWITASGVIGFLVVVGLMGLINLLDGYGPAVLTPEQRQIEEELSRMTELHRQLEQARDRHDSDEEDRIRAELSELDTRVRTMLDDQLRAVTQ